MAITRFIDRLEVFLMQWYLKVVQNYKGFDGRARRKEYWMFTLINGIIYLLLALLMNVADALSIIFLLYYLGVLIPSIAVTIRRLHDIGKSGWWILISFIPIVGGIILFIFTLLDSQMESNQFGANPKAVS